MWLFCDATIAYNVMKFVVTKRPEINT